MQQGMQHMIGASTGPVVGDRFDFLDIFFSYQVCGGCCASYYNTHIAQVVKLLMMQTLQQQCSTSSSTTTALQQQEVRFVYSLRRIESMLLLLLDCYECQLSNYPLLYRRLSVKVTASGFEPRGLENAADTIDEYALYLTRAGYLNKGRHAATKAVFVQRSLAFVSFDRRSSSKIIYGVSPKLGSNTAAPTNCTDVLCNADHSSSSSSRAQQQQQQPRT